MILKEGYFLDKKYEKVVNIIMSNFTGKSKNINNISILMSVLTLTNLLGIINYIYTDGQKVKPIEQKNNVVNKQPEQNKKGIESIVEIENSMGDINNETADNKLINIEELRKNSKSKLSPIVWRFPTK